MPRAFGSDRLRSLVEGAASVAGQTDLQAVLASAVDTAMQITEARYGALGVIGDGDELVDFIYRGIDPDEARGIGALPQGKGLLGVVSRQGRTVRLDDLTTHPDHTGFPPAHPPMSSFLGVPVRAGDQLFGSLYLTDKAGGFTDEDEALVEALALIVGSAIRTVRLQHRIRRFAIAEDRERIAMDLHDSIIQELFAVGLSLQAQTLKVTDPDVRSAIEANVDALDRVITTLRKFIFELPTAEPVDFRTEIREVITSLTSPYDVAVEVSYTGDFTGLSPSVQADIGQFVSEAVSNALRHSGTARIFVRINGGVERLQIEVVDEGSGFDPAEAVWGHGLANLQQRADRLGGTLSIESTPGVGTTVRAVLPR